MSVEVVVQNLPKVYQKWSDAPVEDSRARQCSTGAWNFHGTFMMFTQLPHSCKNFHAPKGCMKVPV